MTVAQYLHTGGTSYHVQDGMDIYVLRPAINVRLS